MGNTAAEICRLAKFLWLSVSVLLLSSCSISGGDSSHIALVQEDNLERVGVPIKALPGSRTYKISGAIPSLFTKIEMCGSGPYKHPLKVYMRELLVGHKEVTLLHNEEFDGRNAKGLVTAGFTSLDGQSLTLCIITSAPNCLEHYVWWVEERLAEPQLNELIVMASKQAEIMGIW